ncbi:MAG: LexA family transcriptional regulator [Novosphingobium sp.]|uniref:LexA family transcriptional regulator n=1 Tax=Novosphingobium sp. TaxID=1874826 RepID=UPI0027354D0D|nr:LexA family transcriptional regulator [Novosphingobium sp.]MDP3550632.1 LexA family transcriptional regulator [Novosphingobium sp.]
MGDLRVNPCMLSGTPPHDPNVFRARLRERLDLLGISPRKASLAIGANQGYVRDLLDPDKTGVPSEARARALATILETTTDWLFGRVQTPEQPKSEVGFLDARRDWRGAPDERLPIYGTGYCDDLEIEQDGHCTRIEQTLFDPTTTVGMIERPAALRFATDAYAIYFHGSSMENRFFQGEIGLVTPTPPPRNGDFVVVQLNDGNGDDVVHVLVKRLVRTTSSYVELEQYNPPIIFRVERQRVTRMHKILGPNEIYMN